jgi:hypothetical protein
MKKVIRLTESDLIRLVKKVINEQMSDNEDDYSNPPKEVGDLNLQIKNLVSKVFNRFPDVCRTNKIYPYDDNVKKAQVLQNQITKIMKNYNPKGWSKATFIKEDGIIGPETKKTWCTLG